MQSGIPKRIIQTGKEKKLSLRNRAISTNLKLLNPEFDYVFYDNDSVESFIEQEFPQYREIFHSFRFPIQRYDFFRYLEIYRYGGFYFDLDVLLASNLSELVEYGCVFPFEGITLSKYLRDNFQMDWEIGNYAFGAVPGHPFLALVIEACVKAQKDPNWAKPMMRGFPWILADESLILNTTGPGLLSRCLAENSEVAKTITVLFPEDLYEENSWNCFGEFGIHLMEGSWRVRAGFLWRRASQYWERQALKSVIREKNRFQGSTQGVLRMEKRKTLEQVSK